MAREKFLLVSLSESKTKELAQAISNETCRKILDYLAEKEATESELAEKLNVPISTVHYNLQQLQKGNLVIVDEFHYSEKGKEVNHYKLANKYIIIAPKSTYGIREKLRGILPVAIILAAGAGIIHFVSKAISYGSVEKLTTITKTLQPSIIANAAESTAASGALQASQNIASEKAIEAAPTVARDLIENVTTATQTTITNPSPISSIVLWFLIGAFLALLIYLIVDWIMHKRN